MSERLPIGADVVEVAYELLSVREPDREDVEAAIRVALDKLGLREEFQSAWAFGAMECSTASEARFYSQHDEGRQAQVRLVSDWRSVDAEPVDSEPSERRSGQVRRSEANTPRSEMLPQRRSGSGRRAEDAQSVNLHVRSADQ